MGAARWGVLSACLAAAVAVLALVAGATGEQQRRRRRSPRPPGAAARGRWTALGRARRSRRARARWAGAGAARRAHGDGSLSPDAGDVRGAAGERSFAGSVALVSHDGHGAARRGVRGGFESSTTAPTSGSTGPWSRGTRDLPALRGPACGSAPAARARRARRLARPRGDEGRCLASHVINFGGVDGRSRSRAPGQRAVAVDRHPPAGNDAVVDVAVGVTPRPPAYDRRARDAGRHRGALPGRPPRSRRPRRSRRVRVARPSCRSRVTRASRTAPGCPRRIALHRERGPARAELERRRLELNGQPLKLRGASLQEDAPGRGGALTDADADAIVARLKAIGANASAASTR